MIVTLPVRRCVPVETMSFLSSITRATRALRPVVPRRFSSSIPGKAAAKSYRSLAWGTAFGVAAYVVSSTQTIHLDSQVTTTPATLSTEEDTIVDPATSIAFPKTMKIPSNLKIPPLQLIGVGVRTVSFLGVKVYSIGFYADLSNPNLKVSVDMPPEEKLDHIIRNTACVIRIVPTRSTSYTHLRDAFVRAMHARLSAGMKDKTITQEMAVEVGGPLRVLKSIFPNSPLSKHTPLDIFLAAPIPNRPRPLIFRDLGSIESDWVATEFVLNYFDASAPSPALKTAVFEKIRSFSN